MAARCTACGGPLEPGHSALLVGDVTLAACAACREVGAAAVRQVSVGVLREIAVQRAPELFEKMRRGFRAARAAAAAYEEEP